MVVDHRLFAFRTGFSIAAESYGNGSLTELIRQCRPKGGQFTVW